MCKLIIWDEAPMVNRCAVETVDKMLRNINDCDLSFGGKVIVLGGDFQHVLPLIPGKFCTYYNFDETIDKSEQSFEEDFLNSLTSNGILPHELNLKINCPVMLLRNINYSKGLCNGTRLTCRKFEKNVILAEITSGEYCGKTEKASMEYRLLYSTIYMFKESDLIIIVPTEHYINDSCPLEDEKGKSSKNDS
ncbi:uncharacterized protein LOC111404637 [Olea europaea var. sylvestris]|uniref:uncharacterized protein LOC111404637 n=1 Tax=Olea europaea var. sylvestris TaxID=158386 RepID=UPI000C1D1BB5|nr:uncharacterized protein LOC111404637 [Olea europaea var. sylvestris]